MSLLAPFFRRTTAASMLFTAAAQCSADLPAEEGQETHRALARGKGTRKQPVFFETVFHLPAVPRSSTALTSAWQLMRSSSMPSTARRAARIRGVVPSCMRASRSVALFLMRIFRDRDRSTGSTNVRQDRQQRHPRLRTQNPLYPWAGPSHSIPSLPWVHIRRAAPDCCLVGLGWLWLSRLPPPCWGKLVTPG